MIMGKKQLVQLLILVGKILFTKKKFIINPKKIKKILIIVPYAIGDVLITTPMIKAIKKNLPKTKIVCLCSDWSKDIIVNNKYVDDVIIVDNNFFIKKKWGMKFIKKLKKEKFDACIVCEMFSLPIFSFLCGIPIRIGFDFNGEGFSLTHTVQYTQDKHVLDYFLDMIKFLGINGHDKKMVLELSKEDIKFAGQHFKKTGFRNKLLIGLCPGGGIKPGYPTESKQWPTQYYEKLVKKLISDYNCNIILIGGQEDNKQAKILSRLDKKRILDFTGKTTIRQSAAVIGRCDLFITNDSAPMHISSAMGVPTVSIFGPTDPMRLAPLNKNSIAVYSKIRCAPCFGTDRFTKCRDHNCITSVRVGEVFNAVMKLHRQIRRKD